MAGEMSVQLAANLVADPELVTIGDKQVCKLRLAHNTRSKRGDEWVNDETWWIEATVWPGFASDAWPENVAASLQKGDAVDVAGLLKREPWESREGKTGIAYRLSVRSIGASLKRAQGGVQKNQARGGAASGGWGGAQAQSSWDAAPSGQGTPAPAGAPAQAGQTTWGEF